MSSHLGEHPPALMRRLGWGILFAVASAFGAWSCGGGSSEDDLARCTAYCQGLRMSTQGCAGELEDCASDCGIWLADAVDAGCPDVFDGILSCTEGSPDPCRSIREECSDFYGAWGECNAQCDVPGDIVFDPPCTSAAPCKSGTKLTMRADKPILCDVRVRLSCAGGTTSGTLAGGDPSTTTGTIELSCTGTSGCGLRVDAANRYLSGSSDVYCTP